MRKGVADYRSDKVNLSIDDICHFEGILLHIIGDGGELLRQASEGILVYSRTEITYHVQEVLVIARHGGGPGREQVDDLGFWRGCSTHGGELWRLCPPRSQHQSKCDKPSHVFVRFSTCS
jgi:hypothetical protein